jgi:glucose/arabinose dehydrogenase
VDARGGGLPYGIPADNPLVDAPGLDEHYAWGFRNLWGISFDGGDLYVADVGERRFEEVNRVEAGGNYGWNVKEGTHCLGADGCPDHAPDDVRGGEPLVDPVIEYPNARHRQAPVSGTAVVGGQVYRGSALPGLAGTYVFGDLQVDGRLFASTVQEGSDHLWDVTVLPIADDEADALGRLFSIARGPAGEVYALGVGSRGGGVYRLGPAE